MTLDRYKHVWLRTAAAPGTVSQDSRGDDCADPYTAQRVWPNHEADGNWPGAWAGHLPAPNTINCSPYICPTCAGPQRVRAFPANYAPTPGLCAAVTTDADQGWLNRCVADLTATTTPRLGRAHPIIKAQNVIYDIIASGTATFGAYR